MRTPGERTSGAWTGGCAIHPDGGDETDRTAGNSYTATPHNTQGANSGQVLLQPYGEPVTDCRAQPSLESKQIVGYKDLDGLIRKEHSIAFRITKEEAIDLPEQTFIKRKVQLGKKEKDLYNQIKRSSYAELSNGDKITATTVLTRLLRLQQLAGGFLVTDDSDKPELVNTAKLDALQDIIEDYVLGAGKKLVIFARFIPEVTAIMKMIDKTFQKTGKKQVAIYGAIKKEDRGPIIKQFQEDPDTVIIVGQIDTLGVGVTLTAADTCVYYSKNFNYATYEQSLSRIHRIGQRNTCTYIDLETEGTVDEMIGKALARKEDMAKTVVDDWRAYFE